jgi:hypothetical protein
VRTIDSGIASRTVGVDELARELGMSRRSLERALADEGTSAGALLEDERKQRALAWLPTMSVEEVASRWATPTHARSPARSSAGPACPRAALGDDYWRVPEKLQLVAPATLQVPLIVVPAMAPSQVAAMLAPDAPV